MQDCIDIFIYSIIFNPKKYFTRFNYLKTLIHRVCYLGKRNNLFQSYKLKNMIHYVYLVGYNIDICHKVNVNNKNHIYKILIIREIKFNKNELL